MDGMRQKKRVLLIEDEPFFVKWLTKSMSAFPEIEIEVAGRLDDGLEKLAAGAFDAVLVDLTLPDSAGFETFRGVRQAHPDIPLIVLTGLDDEALALKIVQRGAQDYLLKGAIDPSGLERSIYYAIERQQGLRELEQTVRERTAELSQANRQLKVLHEIDKAILAAHSPYEIAQVALELLRQLIPFDRAEVIVFSDPDNRARIIASDVYGRPTTTGRRFPTAGIGEIERLRKGRPYVVADLSAVKMPSPVEERLLRGDALSYASLPLILENRLIGVLLLGADKRGVFTNAYLDIAREMSAQLAVAIQNALLFEKVLRGQKRLRLLTKQLVSAQEDERRRLSLELHDEAGQALIGLKINLSLLLSDLPAGRDDALQAGLQSAIEQVDNTQEQLRLLAHNLRPPALDTLGLNRTLEEYCLKFANQTKLEIIYQGVEIADLSGEMSITIYRFLQEALTNVARHAQAAQARVILSNLPQAVEISVIDDGKGFDFHSSKILSGIGLLGMQERIEGLGGQLEIHSQAKMGTRLRAKIPRQEAR